MSFNLKTCGLEASLLTRKRRSFIYLCICKEEIWTLRMWLYLMLGRKIESWSSVYKEINIVSGCRRLVLLRSLQNWYFSSGSRPHNRHIDICLCYIVRFNVFLKWLSTDSQKPGDVTQFSFISAATSFIPTYLISLLWCPHICWFQRHGGFQLIYFGHIVFNFTFCCSNLVTIVVLMYHV